MLALGKSIRIALLAALGCVAGTQAYATDTTFFAILKGGNEVSAGGQANAGDPDGYGSASVVFRSNGRICYSIIVMRIDRPTAAHIHRGNAGVNGPIVVPLTPPVGGSLGHVSDCIAIDPAVGGNIRNDSAGFYVNVHTGQFPGGALRGQLF
ncbi:MAG: CHRD domain-containing protein [Rhizobiales bacterium]|nr:CHRD domain-containing protein [Hyphomicrobiales bacterium]